MANPPDPVFDELLDERPAGELDFDEGALDGLLDIPEGEAEGEEEAGELVSSEGFEALENEAFEAFQAQDRRGFGLALRGIVEMALKQNGQTKS